ncbi:fibronectin type III domain-containing protein 1 isoform X2 [Melanotaenia boesemani]|uniref:fibronectin type III domain-containing protein 1 isoform X2 n=1 Tax=Melanotaenia boesemani TaxID=1250792 RepID=UPI001C03BB24|nr:fibronectin type III domain-containing protein 1 isoform X2 [Melanotaenia boesemani]
MALAASRTLLVLFVTFCAPGCGWTAEKSLRPQNGKQTSVDKVSRESWEHSSHLDGTPVDRYVSSHKPPRSHRFTKVSKESHTHPIEDVDPDWDNLDGFAVVPNPPINNSSAGLVRFSQNAARSHSTAERTTRAGRMTHPAGVTYTRTHKRAPQSSSGPRQPERALAGTPLLKRRRPHSAKPQADQRKRHTPKLTSESVHVVSLQAQKAQGQSAPANRAVPAIASIPEPPEYEARDLSVRVMSPKSVLISWVDPAVEMGKVAPGTSRSYTVRFREKGESARWDYKDSTQRRVMIDALSADSMYEFSVRISQGEKHGKWGVSVFQRTPESAPSGPPENFEVKPLRGKGTAVIATWDLPEEPNGRIREYILSYAPAMKPFGMKSTTYSGSTTTTTIDGLTPGERYIFKIRATNRRGMGPQSKVFSVAMPESRSIASSSSKSKGSQQTSNFHSKKDTDHNESNLQSSELPEEPTTTPKPRPVNRRLRPLSQTRSYHSIFSSVRGSVRNVVNRERPREDEQEKDKIPTTAPPAEETTTEVVLETKEPDNNVSPVSEDEVGHDKEPLTTEAPSLKVLTPSPTKPAYIRPNRRPVKIRVHKKAESKASSSFSSGGSSSSSSKLSSASSATSSVSSASADSSLSLPSSSSASLPFSSSSSIHTQESEASRKDYVASTYPEKKNIYNKPSITQAKPSTTGGKETSSQQTGATPKGRGSSSAGRSSSSESGFSSRYGYGQRHPGTLLGGNATRLLNGYKPAITTQLNLPRTQSQATLKTQSLSKAHSAAPDRTENHDTSHTFIPDKSRSPSRSTLDSQTTSDSYSFDKSQSTLESRSQSSTALQGINPSTSQNSGIHPLTADTSSFSQSASRTGTRSSSATHNTHNSQGVHTSLDQETSYEEGNKDNNNENVEDANPKGSEATLRRQTTEEIRREVGKDESTNEKPVVSRTGLNPSFVERFPLLASRYPGRFGSNARATSSRQDGRTPSTRFSSSVGADRPLLTQTRVSGAVGAAGVPLIQETTEDLRTSSTHDSLKNGIGANSFKPSLTNQNTGSSDTRNPTTSSSSSASSNSDSYHFSNVRKDSSKPIHGEASNVNSNGQHKDYSGERNGQRSRKFSDPTESQKNPPMTSAVHRNAEDSESTGTRDTSIRTRSGTSSAVNPNYRHPGVGINARGRSPILMNRQFGGSRLPFRAQPAQNSRLGASTTDSSSSSSDSSSSSHLPQPVLTSDRDVGSGTTVTKTEGLIGGNPPSTSSLSSSRDNLRKPGSRPRFPMRGKPINGGGFKPGNGNGKNGRPNLTAAMEKDSTSSRGTSKAAGQRFITGPDGTKWVLDLEQGVLMNQDGQVLQDSQGKPKRVVLGEDGRTIFDHRGSPLVSQEGIALFGHGRDSQPVINPKDKVLMVGGKPVLGLDIARPRTTTTTIAPTTTPELTTTEWTTEELTTALPFPTCPPGTFSKTDEYGYPVPDPEGILDCYPEDEMILQTTLLPSTAPTTTISSPATEPQTRPFNESPSSAFDLSGKKRFTAPYVNYIRKDPGAPCSLTEALEYLQVDVLENLLEKDSPSANQKQPPKNKPHNLTVVAMEGCHSFIILDWARPLKDDMVSGYMVHSASYDDVLNNRWSSRASSGTHLPVENLKPNSRYYFKVQAKNVFGLGPFSDTLTYVTESDDPLLIERPPGGEPIWVPFTFKYNPVHSSCKGSQYVKRTWYRKFVGVVLCNSLRYKIFMGDGLREPFYSIGDTVGQGEDHCQFVDSYRDGRTGPAYLSNNLPSAQGFYRAYRQEPVAFGVIGRRTPYPFVGWYECGVPIPGKW